jgi:RNA polymerase sigma factor (sigma-70 family)
LTEQIAKELIRENVVAFPDRMQDRDTVAFNLEQVFCECRPRLIRFLKMRLGSESDAEDAAQLTFLRLWQRHFSLSGESLLALIFVTARNIATDIVRERRRRGLSTSVPSTASCDIDEIRDECVSPSRSAEAQQYLDLIPRLLDELPPKCKSVFLAYKFQGLSYSEISAGMGVTESMVRKYVIKALAHCSARFDRLEGWE